MSLNRINPALTALEGTTRQQARSDATGGRFEKTLKQTLASVPGAAQGPGKGLSPLESIKSLIQIEFLEMQSSLLSSFNLTDASPSGRPGLGGFSGADDWLNIMRMVAPGAKATEAEGRTGSGTVMDELISPAETSGLQPGNPHNFDAIIERTARSMGLDPNLIRAVVKTESNFQADAVSHAGAMGLMQLMPDTADDMGLDDPFDPVQNISGGSKYLKMMLERYDGDLDSALAAYNWGPGNLDRSRSGKLPEETTNYIERVNRYFGEFASASIA